MLRQNSVNLTKLNIVSLFGMIHFVPFAFPHHQIIIVMRRFRSSQSLDSTVWRLSIEPTLHTDAGGPLIIIITITIFIIIKVIIISSFFEGMYECQISTEPKISKLYKLTITGTYSDMIFVQSFTPVDFLAL